MTSSTSPPVVVAWLGYGGLIPFVALAIAAIASAHHALPLSDALIAYGAIILSFVGALHWGFAMTLDGLTTRQRNARFVWSTVPPLVAWPAVMLTADIASVILVAGFLAHYAQDRRLARNVTMPAWYLPMRTRLTTVASIALLAGGFATQM